jgi:hypothetical protein
VQGLKGGQTPFDGVGTESRFVGAAESAHRSFRGGGEPFPDHCCRKQSEWRKMTSQLPDWSVDQWFNTTKPISLSDLRGKVVVNCMDGRCIS